jgi:hypothetical protein
MDFVHKTIRMINICVQVGYIVLLMVNMKFCMHVALRTLGFRHLCQERTVTFLFHVSLEFGIV